MPPQVLEPHEGLVTLRATVRSGPIVVEQMGLVMAPHTKGLSTLVTTMSLRKRAASSPRLAVGARTFLLRRPRPSRPTPWSLCKNVLLGMFDVVEGGGIFVGSLNISLLLDPGLFCVRVFVARVATFHSSSNPDRIFYLKRFRIGNSIRQGFFFQKTPSDRIFDLKRFRIENSIRRDFWQTMSDRISNPKLFRIENCI